MKHGDILLVEDNKYHAELTLRALKKMELEEKTCWVKDGEGHTASNEQTNVSL